MAADLSGSDIGALGLEQSPLDLTRDIQLRLLHMPDAVQLLDIVDIGIDLIGHRVEGM